MPIKIMACPDREQLVHITRPHEVIRFALPDAVKNYVGEDFDEHNRRWSIIGCGLLLEWLVKFLMTSPSKERPFLVQRDIVEYLMSASISLTEDSATGVTNLYSTFSDLISGWHAAIGPKSRILCYLGGIVQYGMPEDDRPIFSDALMFSEEEAISAIEESIKHNISTDLMSLLEAEANKLDLSRVTQDSLGVFLSEAVKERMERMPLPELPDSLSHEEFWTREVETLLEPQYKASLVDTMVRNTIARLQHACLKDVIERLCSMLWIEWEPKYRLIPFSTPGF